MSHEERHRVEERLLPCPFCGETPQVRDFIIPQEVTARNIETIKEIRDIYARLQIEMDIATNRDLSATASFVECSNPKCYMTARRVGSDAIRQWNTRASSAPGSEEELDKAHERFKAALIRWSKEPTKDALREGGDAQINYAGAAVRFYERLAEARRGRE